MAIDNEKRKAIYDYFASLDSHSTYRIDAVAESLRSLGFHVWMSFDKTHIEVEGITIRVVQPDYGTPGIDGLEMGMLLCRILFGGFVTEYSGRGWIYRDILEKLGSGILDPEGEPPPQDRGSTT